MSEADKDRSLDTEPGGWNGLSPGEAMRRLHEAIQELIGVLEKKQ